MIVLIDDERSFRIPLPDEPLVFRNSASALQWLTDNPTPHITQLWLDHDLGGDDTIMPVVNAIERRIIFGIPLTIDEVIIHTANPVGAQQLEDILSNHYPTIRVPAIDYLIADVQR